MLCNFDEFEVYVLVYAQMELIHFQMSIQHVAYYVECAKSPQCVIGGTGRENIMTQCCVSATGHFLLPYILYSGQRLMFDYTQRGPAGAK